MPQIYVVYGDYQSWGDSDFWTVKGFFNESDANQLRDSLNSKIRKRNEKRQIAEAELVVLRNTPGSTPQQIREAQGAILALDTPFPEDPFGRMGESTEYIVRPLEVV